MLTLSDYYDDSSSSPAARGRRLGDRREDRREPASADPTAAAVSSSARDLGHRAAGNHQASESGMDFKFVSECACRAAAY